MGVTMLIVCLLAAFGLSAYAFLEYQEALDEVMDLNAQISELAYTETSITHTLRITNTWTIWSSSRICWRHRMKAF